MRTIKYFEALAEQNRIPYQNLINLYLRECAQSEKKPNDEMGLIRSVGHYDSLSRGPARSASIAHSHASRSDEVSRFGASGRIRL